MMNVGMLKEPRSINKLVWIVALLLLVTTLAAGSVTFYRVHAASLWDGRYTFRAVTTAGPQAGYFITGQLDLRLTSATTIQGGMCGLNYAPSHCVNMNGTTADGVHVAMSFLHIAGFPDLQLAGAFQSSAGKHGGFTGFSGTFTFGASSGHWEALRESAVNISGSYYLYALITKGSAKGQTIHGVLNIVQLPNNVLSGTFCPTHRACEVTNGNNYTDGGYVFVYISITPKTASNLQLRGTLSGPHRLNGQFQAPGPGGTLSEQGYWLAH